MSRKEPPSVQTQIDGGNVQGIIGGEVNVQQLIIYNYASAKPKEEKGLRCDKIPDNPYKGLAHFGPTDSALFFGRETTISHLVDAVQHNSFVALSGYSGSGKSSVVLAGLAPRLNTSGEWIFTYFRVSDSTEKDPCLALAQALLPLYAPVLNKTEQLIQRRKLGAALRERDISITDVLDTIRRNHPNKRVLLIADQFEELYTSNINLAAQRQFIDLLLTATSTADHVLSLVITIRADFLGVAALHRPLADAINTSSYILGSMSVGELREVIEKPAETQGVHFQDGLVETILDDVGEDPGNLPLLEFSLSLLWQGQMDKQLTLATYQEIGRVAGALTHHADSIYEHLADEEKEQAREIFKQLVKLGLGTEDTRRVAIKENFDELWPTVQKLADEKHRLVVINTTTQETQTAEVIHEALIKHWGRLKQWVDEDRQFLMWKDSFRVLLSQWENHHRQESELLRGGALSQAEEWQKQRAASFSASEIEFIESSTKARDVLAKEEEVRRQKSLRQAKAVTIRNKVIAIIAVVTVVVTSAIGWQLYEANTVAVDEKNNALRNQSRYLVDLSRQATESGDAVTGALLALEALPDSSAGVQRPYLHAAEFRLYSALQVLFEHGILRGPKGRTSGEFSPDGTRIVTASDDGNVRLWDSATGDPLAVLVGHDGVVNSAQFSPDGTRIVTASLDGTARLWDSATGDPLAVLVGHDGVVNSAQFSPDGTRIVTASDDGTARLWASATGDPLAVLVGHNDSVMSAQFSPDGTRIVTASWDGNARLWDSATGDPLAVLVGHDGGLVSSARFSPDGTRIVTASLDGTARLWDSATGDPLAVLVGHDNGVMSAQFSPDGTRIVTASDDGTAQLWASATGDPLAVLVGHDDSVMSAQFSPDGTRIVTASLDGNARLWDSATGDPLAVLVGHDNGVMSAQFSPDGTRIVTASWDGTARLWGRATLDPLAVLVGHDDSVNSAQFSPDGSRIVTASDDGTARLWDSATGDPLAVLVGHDDSVMSAQFSPDVPRIVTVSYDGTARLWDSATGDPLAVLVGHDGVVNSAQFSPDGTRIVTASDDGTARLWASATGDPLAVLVGHDDSVMSAQFSPDGTRIVTASLDGNARLWDSATGDPLAVLVGHDDSVMSAQFSPDVPRIVTVSDDGTARLWDTATGDPLTVLVEHDSGVILSQFSPDDTRVVTASWDGTARIWDSATGDPLAVLVGHDDSVMSAQFSPDGTRVVTASWDGTARLWDSATGAPLAVLVERDGGVMSAQFSPDGTRVVTTSWDGTVRVWGVFKDTQSLIDYANSILPRRLSPKQRIQFFLDSEE
ncbi:WD40 repeat domain-containing protein [Vibrio sp. PID17_43]|uniref:WD40 repeat domain-containing protein n=1 Tax=Vibrio sp. PID17_43 TaxID=1583451 RepID=UPI000BFFC933|nr:WD40 repeat domain-containing protein [Vibrio sp. PID17_43]